MIRFYTVEDRRLMRVPVSDSTHGPATTIELKAGKTIELRKPCLVGAPAVHPDATTFTALAKNLPRKLRDIGQVEHYELIDFLRPIGPQLNRRAVS